MTDRPTDEELQKLGLYDPSWPHADDLLQLLHYLLDLGATTDDLLEYQAELPGVATVVSLRPGVERLTPAEVVERAGVTDDFATKLQRAVGLPDAPDDAKVFSEAEVAMLQTLKAAVTLFGEDAVIQLARVIGSAMAKIADALVSSFLVNIEVPILERDPVGIEIARANAAASALLPPVVSAMDVLLRRQIIAMRRSLQSLRESGIAGYEIQRLAVGFVDIVGSTALTMQLSTGEYGRALAAFESQAADIVTDRRGRVVKLIGDEVMFVAPGPGSACSIALALTDAFARHPVVPPVRAGVASGEVLSRDGDYFGPVVNLAARIVKAADPRTLVVPGDVRKEVEAAGFVVSSRGTRLFEGLAEPVELLVVSRS